MAVKNIRTCDVTGQRIARHFRLVLLDITELGQEVVVEMLEADLSARAVKRAKHFMQRAVSSPNKTGQAEAGAAVDGTESAA